MNGLPEVPQIRTARLLLRGWREGDLAPFAAMNADPAVMRHLGGPMSRFGSDVLVGRFLEKWEEQPRVGWWALEETASGRFLGFVGLARPDFTDPPAPCIEIGWRLATSAWGQGFATEAALACLGHGFAAVGLPQVLSFAVPGNARSRAVMDRIGMRRDADADFDHPLVPAGSPLRAHVLYRLTRAEWEARGGG